MFDREAIKAKLPPPAIKAFKATHSGLKRFLRALSYPILPRLAHEILALERSKDPNSLGKLAEFPELKDSAWGGLGTLGYALVRRYKPKVIVELGSHMGFSALAMGLALRDLGEGGKLYAIDTWQGDPQATFYGDEVYETFLKRGSQLGLEAIITPLRMLFSEGVAHVTEPVDLLHIDGLHTYEAVSQDLADFGPKVRPGGIILFHDVDTWFPDMKAFWREISRKYESHLVPHTHGLGVIRVPEGGLQLK